METARSGDEAAAAAGVGKPVAVRLLSRHIVHKSDAGGVVLGVGSAEGSAVRSRESRRTRSHAESHGLPREDPAVTIAPMLDPPVAELLVGACRDPQLGPVLTLGAGGVWVEVLRDVTHRVLPVDGGEVEAALSELKVNALLAGARGGVAVQRAPIVGAALAVAECVTRWPEVAEVRSTRSSSTADRWPRWMRGWCWAPRRIADGASGAAAPP